MPANRRPNIVIFNPDQRRGDVLGHMGNPAAETPILDSMVEIDAVSFRYAFCQNPVCTPSRCSFMTGWYPHVRGHRTMFHMLRPGEPNLLRNVRENGYFVWWGGKNDLVPAQHGYGDYCDVKHKADSGPYWGGFQAGTGHPDDDNYYSFYVGKLNNAANNSGHLDPDWSHVSGAADFIRSAPQDRPFCVYLPLVYPHPPYAVEEPWFGRIDRDRLPARIPVPHWDKKPSILSGIQSLQGLQAWDERRWNELRAAYYGMCARVDYQLGLVLDALRSAGHYDDTALFFFSDHGDFTGDYGLVEKTQNTFEDCLTRVPLVVKPPAWMDVRPRVSDALVELIDVPATIESIIGVTPPHTHFGRSLSPVIGGDTDEHRDAVFCEGGRLHGENHCMELESTIRDHGMISPYWPRLSLQRSSGPEHTKAAMCRTRDVKYVRRLYERDELYDLRDDPQETVNRIDDPAMAEPRARLSERLLTWYQETCDAVPPDPDRRG